MAKERINVKDAEKFGLLFNDFCNMNDSIAVVLTKRGAEMLNDYNKASNRRFPKCYPDATDYKEGDVFEGQMWCIFERFPDKWHIGADAPFTRIMKRK